MKKVIILFALLNIVVFAQDIFIDPRDGKKYKTTKIGKQIWMAENLNYAADSSKCYDNKPANCDKYGRLYNWKTAKKACPSGWHLPSDADWNVLMKYVNPSCSDKIHCDSAGTKLKATSGWEEGYGGESGNGTDNYGFSALPGGWGNFGGNFFDAADAHWWSSSENNANSAYLRQIGSSENVYYNFNIKISLLSVRCLQGAETEQKSVGNKEAPTETMKRPIQSNDRTSPAGQTKSNKARKKGG